MAKRREGKAIREDIDRIVESFIYLYTEGRRLSQDISNRYGLTATQLGVLKMLHDMGGGLNLSSLSQRIRLNNSTVTGIVDRMERDGLLVRERSGEDRRVVNLHLTAKGQKLAAKITITPWEALRRAVADLPQVEKRRLFTILRRVASNIQNMVDREMGTQPTKGSQA